VSNKAVQAILPILAMLTVTSTVLSYQGLPNAGKSGVLVSSVWAMESVPVEKEVGQSVCFKVKVKNTGTVDATYIIVAEFKEHGTEEWQTVGHGDVSLSPGEYSEILVLGYVSCTEAMVGKYYDVRFVLYDAETEEPLDQKVIPELVCTSVASARDYSRMLGRIAHSYGLSSRRPDVPSNPFFF